jgi:hypothetical protein
MGIIEREAHAEVLNLNFCPIRRSAIFAPSKIATRARYTPKKHPLFPVKYAEDRHMFSRNHPLVGRLVPRTPLFPVKSPKIATPIASAQIIAHNSF